MNKNELIGGNALINTGTFLAILAGTVSGTMLMTINNGAAWVSALFFVTALIGYISSRYIPLATPPRHMEKIPLNPLRENVELLSFALKHDKDIAITIIAKAWFFFIGSLFLAQFANYTHDTVHGTEEVLTLFLVLFSVGIGVGGLFNNLLLKGIISRHLVPLAGLAISAFTIDLYAASQNIPMTEGDLTSLSTFLAHPSNWRIIVDLFLLSASGGIFVIPLAAFIQDNAPEQDRARIVAASSVSDSLFIIVSTLLSAGLIALDFSIPELFLTFGLMNIVACLLFWRNFRGKDLKEA